MNINIKNIRAKFIQIIAISNPFNIPKILVPKSNLFPSEIFSIFTQAKILPTRTNIDEITKITNNTQLKALGMPKFVLYDN